MRWLQIGALLQEAESCARNAQKSLTARDLDFAYVDYLKAFDIVVNIVPHHEDFPSLNLEHGELWKQNKDLQNVRPFHARHKRLLSFLRHTATIGMSVANGPYYDSGSIPSTAFLMKCGISLSRITHGRKPVKQPRMVDSLRRIISMEYHQMESKVPPNPEPRMTDRMQLICQEARILSGYHPQIFIGKMLSVRLVGMRMYRWIRKGEAKRTGYRVPMFD